MAVKPFKSPGYTMFDNIILDYIMPRISANAWKILCVTIRQTWGWSDSNSPSGRKQKDKISYSQYRAKTGIKSDSTVRRAIKECIDAGFLLSEKSDNGQEIYYSLNIDFELDTSTEIVEGQETDLYKNCRGASTEIVEVEPETSTEIVDTKESIKEKERKDDSLSDDDFSDLWSDNDEKTPKDRLVDRIRDGKLTTEDFAIATGLIETNPEIADPMQPWLPDDHPVAIVAQHIAGLINAKIPRKYKKRWEESWQLPIEEMLLAFDGDVDLLINKIDLIYQQDEWLQKNAKSANYFVESVLKEDSGFFRM